MPLLQSLAYSGVPGGIVRAASSVAQLLVAATLTLINGTKVRVPLAGLKVGSRYKVHMALSKTAAGTATSTYAVRFGTLGTTADTAVLSFTKPAGDATIDDASIDIIVTVRSIGATGVFVGQFQMGHNLAATGFLTIPQSSQTVVSGAVDMTIADAYLSVSATTGAAEAVTVNIADAELTGV